jgi:hypothetical protein
MGVMLCIDGLPLPFTSKELRELAEAHGQVIKCWIVHEPGTETSLRFGYIEAATAVDAERMSAELTGQKLNCKLCTVDIEKMG